MKQKNLRRIVAGASAVTLTAGLTAAFGMTTANAAPESSRWTESDKVGITYYYSLERTISDTNPAVGDEITVSTRFYNPPVDWYIESVKDLHNSCLTYVPESATYGGDPVNVVPGSDATATFVSAPSLPRKRIGGNSDVGYTFSLKYTVGESCVIGAPLNSTAHFTSSTIDRSPQNKGPIVTVKKAASTTALTVSPDPESGTASTLTATVGPDAATGEVEFFNGTTSLGKADLKDHKASFAWTPTTVEGGKSYSITAKYLGDVNRVGSTSIAKAGTVAVGLQAPAAPNNLVASANPTIVGESVTISGRAEALSDVAVTAGAQSCNVKAGGNGAFSCSITPGAAGQIAVTATATNPAGTSLASAPLTLTVNDAPVIPVAPSAPQLSLAPSSVNVGETVTATIKTVPGAALDISINNDAPVTITANGNGDATHKFDGQQAGTTTVSVTATNAGGTSPATVGTVEVKALPQGALGIALNPAAPAEGQIVNVTVSGADPNSDVTIKNGDVTICTSKADDNGIATCDWKPTAGDYDLTISATVGGAEKVQSKSVTVSPATPVDPGPGGENPGDGNNGGSGSLGSTGSLGSLGSVSNIFGSLK